MKKFITLLLLVNVAVVLQGQDVIYTIHYEKNGANTYLDSILFENLTNHTRLVFGGLTIQNSYAVNLTQQKLEVTTGVIHLKNEGPIFNVLKNIPGEISLQWNDKLSEDVDLSVLNLNGRKIFSQKISANTAANTLRVTIPIDGMFILHINSTRGETSFKVIGSGSFGSIKTTTFDNNKPLTTNPGLKSVSEKNESGFSYQEGDSIRVTGYMDGISTYPVVFEVNESDTLNLFFVGEEEDYFIVGNVKYPLNLGHNVWLSELDCGNFDVYAHGLYLTTNITINKYGDQSGKSLFPKGKGNMVVFNLFNKDSTLVPGKYIFIDDVDCSGEVTDGDSTYTMGESDKFVSAIKEMIDPTFYGLNIDLEIDWNTVDFDNPSADVINKYTNYMNSMVGLKEGSVTVEKNYEKYTVTFNCIDTNGLVIKGKYTGNLNFVEFGI